MDTENRMVVTKKEKGEGRVMWIKGVKIHGSGKKLDSGC